MRLVHVCLSLFHDLYPCFSQQAHLLSETGRLMWQYQWQEWDGLKFEGAVLEDPSAGW